MDDKTCGRDQDPFLQFFAAELTLAAYPVALRQGVGDSWVDLERELWATLAETLREWEYQSSEAAWPAEFEGWREDLRAKLTDAAYRIALKYAAKKSFLDLELGLYQAFRGLTEEMDFDTILTGHALIRPE